MSSSDQAVIGAILILGFVLFAVAASLPERGGISRRVWAVPHEEAGSNPRLWRFTNGLFAASGAATVVGLVLLGVHLNDEGSSILALSSVSLFVIAAVLWIMFAMYRSTVILWAAAHYEVHGRPPSGYQPLASWANALGSSYMMLSYVAAVLLGAALLETGVVALWIGWVAIAVGVARSAVMVAGWPKPSAQDETIAHIPAWAQIVPVLVGISLVVESL